MTSKKNILIIFGGKSGEHEVSVRSAQSIEKYIDKEKFNVSCLGVTQEGKWHLGTSVAEITSGLKVLPPNTTLSLPAGNEKALVVQTKEGLMPLAIDVVFPIIHGTNGEDGTLQGFLELANLPYVGANVLGSAVSMDKVIQKIICAQHDIPQAEYVYFTKHEWDTQKTTVLQKIKQLSYPLFAKPANLGSSVGISKVKNDADLEAAIETALKYDLKCIVEQGVTDIIEVEVAVLGNEEPEASVCGSITPNTEFYDYETKYVTDDVKMEIPANIPEDVSNAIRDAAKKAFVALNCFGLSRIDFFYQPSTGRYYLNEVNTLPGFTSISMYPKLWEATGVTYTELITRLLELAEARWHAKQSLTYTY